MYKIEKNVPIPERKTAPNKKYPFTDMEVGDSFVVFEKDEFDRVRRAANQQRRRTGIRFLSYTDDFGNLRVWRVE